MPMAIMIALDVQTQTLTELRTVLVSKASLGKWRAILLLVLIKNSFSDITDDDDRIIDRSNVEQQTYLRKKK
jgi:hypothetical protein